MRYALLIAGLVLVYFAMTGIEFLLTHKPEDVHLRVVIVVVSVILFGAIWLISYAQGKL